MTFRLFSEIEPHPRSFASDNNAGVHPQVLAAIAEANVGHVLAYGHDPYTAHAEACFAKHFGPDAKTFFVYGGTGANCLGLAALTKSYNAILCSETAHIYEDETGAPEKFTGCRLFPVKSHGGKIRVEDLQAFVGLQGVEHKSQPKVVSITQTTEYGTVYTPAEVRAIANFAHAHNMYLHMDGARIFNAAVALDTTNLASFTKDVGVDVLSFGGTKIGLMCGEAVVFFRPELATEFRYLRKHGLQLSSKMRFVSAQFSAIFHDDLGFKNAAHANAMARYLADQLRAVPQVAITQPVQANGVFAKLERRVITELRKSYPFHEWDPAQNEVRWMTSFDTTPGDVDAFVAAIKRI